MPNTEKETLLSSVDNSLFVVEVPKGEGSVGEVRAVNNGIESGYEQVTENSLSSGNGVPGNNALGQSYQIVDNNGYSSVNGGTETGDKQKDSNSTNNQYTSGYEGFVDIGAEVTNQKERERRFEIVKQSALYVMPTMVVGLTFFAALRNPLLAGISIASLGMAYGLDHLKGNAELQFTRSALGVMGMPFYYPLATRVVGSAVASAVILSIGMDGAMGSTALSAVGNFLNTTPGAFVAFGVAHTVVMFCRSQFMQDQIGSAVSSQSAELQQQTAQLAYDRFSSISLIGPTISSMISGRGIRALQQAEKASKEKITSLLTNTSLENAESHLIYLGDSYMRNFKMLSDLTPLEAVVSKCMLQVRSLVEGAVGKYMLQGMSEAPQGISKG
jgi:hypothetical protein